MYGPLLSDAFKINELTEKATTAQFHFIQNLGCAVSLIALDKMVLALSQRPWP